ncbi:MAG: hypothetical protein M3336_09650 [Chloroflexota bacterium]|nr:hypothetical protein [Chloroflexota bacterium]
MPIAKRVLVPVLVVFAVAILGLAIGAVLRVSSAQNTRLGAFTLVSDANAAGGSVDVRIDKNAASERALERLQILEPEIRGFEINDATLTENLTRIERGSDTVFTSSDPIAAAWVLTYEGPANGEFSTVTALAIVDAVTGEVHTAAVSQSNE